MDRLSSAVWGRRFAIGVGVGLIPAALMTLFGFTQCPVTDYTCRAPDPTIGVDLLGATIAIYLLEVLATVVCFIWRAAQPVAWGLLLMLFVNPIFGAVGFILVVNAHHVNAHHPAASSGTFVAVGAVLAGFAVDARGSRS